MEQKVYIPCTEIKGANNIEIEVMYMKGEQWNRCYDRRGYYMAVRPVEITPMHFADKYIDIVTSGCSERSSRVFFLEGTERKSPKRLGEFVAKMNAHAKEIVDAFVRQDYNAVWAYV